MFLFQLLVVVNHNPSHRNNTHKKDNGRRERRGKNGTFVANCPTVSSRREGVKSILVMTFSIEDSYDNLRRQNKPEIQYTNAAF